MRLRWSEIILAYLFLGLLSDIDNFFEFDDATELDDEA